MKIVNQNAELPKNAKSKVEESQKQYQQGKFTEFVAPLVAMNQANS